MVLGKVLLISISDMSWVILPAVTRKDQSTVNLLQFSDDPVLLIFTGRHDGRDGVKPFMAEKSSGTNALHWSE